MRICLVFSALYVVGLSALAGCGPAAGVGVGSGQMNLQFDSNLGDTSAQQGSDVKAGSDGQVVEPEDTEGEDSEQPSEDFAVADAGDEDVNETDVPVEVGKDTAQEDSGPVDTGPNCKVVTYDKEAQPILQQYCSGGDCHSGGFPDFCPSAQKATLLNKYLKTGVMPPKGHAQPSAADKAVIAAWLKAGAKCSIPGCE